MDESIGIPRHGFLLLSFKCYSIVSLCFKPICRYGKFGCDLPKRPAATLAFCLNRITAKPFHTVSLGDVSSVLILTIGYGFLFVILNDIRLSKVFVSPAPDAVGK